MQMLGNRVLLEKIVTENKTKSGILLPSEEKERTCLCKVISVGNQVTEIEKGETVMADSYKLQKLNEYFYCDFSDIIGIIEQ